MRKMFSALLALSICATAPLAGADDVANAQAKFRAGATAYREARYKDAIDLFLAANALDPHPELIYNVGQAYEKLGDVPNALRSYRDYLRAAPDAGDRATVETSIRNLEQRLREKGLQQVSVFSTPVGATVYLDGKQVGATPWTGEIGPGRHQVVLRATGFPDNAKEFVLNGDRAMDIDIAMSKSDSGAVVVGTATVASAAGSASAAPTAAVTAKPDATAKPDDKGKGDTPSPGIRPLTWVVLAGGVAGLAAAGGLEAARKGAEDAARNEPTQIGYKEKYDSMVTNQTAARVMTGVGAAVLAVGGVLLILDLKRGSASGPKAAIAPEPPKAGARVGVGCSGAGCWLSASGSF
jgi:tetratricopeptide (TPR) repeat protein